MQKAGFDSKKIGQKFISCPKFLSQIQNNVLRKIKSSDLHYLVRQKGVWTHGGSPPLSFLQNQKRHTLYDVFSLVRQKGVEPPTYCLEGSCSIQLSYWRKKNGAGDGNRTHATSLEGWNSTIELHPHISFLIFQLSLT